jgi:hypothetical protein
MMLPAHVRFGSLADICAAKSDVRFTPNSDRESGFPQKVSALPPKADIHVVALSLPVLPRKN